MLSGMPAFSSAKIVYFSAKNKLFFHIASHIA